MSNFQVIDFRCYDVILKVDWVKQYNMMLFDFVYSQITFRVELKEVGPQGIVKPYQVAKCVL